MTKVFEFVIKFPQNKEKDYVHENIFFSYFKQIIFKNEDKIWNISYNVKKEQILEVIFSDLAQIQNYRPIFVIASEKIQDDVYSIANKVESF